MPPPACSRYGRARPKARTLHCRTSATRPEPGHLFAITVSIRVRDGAAGEIQTMVHACVRSCVRQELRRQWGRRASTLRSTSPGRRNTSRRHERLVRFDEPHHAGQLGSGSMLQPHWTLPGRRSFTGRAAHRRSSAGSRTLHERGGEPICMGRAELLWQHAVVDEAGGGLKVAGGPVDQAGRHHHHRGAGRWAWCVIGGDLAEGGQGLGEQRWCVCARCRRVREAGSGGLQRGRRCSGRGSVAVPRRCEPR
jgi:hypothetical protein